MAIVQVLFFGRKSGIKLRCGLFHHLRDTLNDGLTEIARPLVKVVSRFPTTDRAIGGSLAAARFVDDDTAEFFVEKMLGR